VGLKRKPKKREPLERRYQRASSQFPAEFAWGTVVHSARVSVVSLGGCFLSSEVIVPPDEEVELNFTIAGVAPVRCHGKVVWISERGIKVRDQLKQRGFALEFKQIYPEDRAKIDDYIKRQTRLFRHVEHELAKTHPDKDLVKELFARACPGESTNLNHVRKMCREEVRYFRLRI
jgi:hypothetical protein